MRLVSIVCSVTIDPQPQCNETKWKSALHALSIHAHSPQAAKPICHARQVFWLIPVTTPSRFSPVAEIVDPSCARFWAGTYSSGNCCRLSRHSLLIGRRLYGLLSEPLRGKDTKFTSNKKCFYFLLVCVVLYWSFCLYQYVASPRHSFRSLYKYPVANIVKIDNTVRNTIVLRTIGGCLR